MIAALSVPELHIFSLLSVITKFNFPVLYDWQNGESSCDLLLSVTNRKALAPGGIFRLCASVVCLCISVMQKKKICFKQDFLHIIIQKLAKIYQHFKVWFGLIYV